MHLSSSYAKILGQKLFCTQEFLRSGLKAKDGDKEKKERTMVITMAKLCMAQASTHGARKPPGPKDRTMVLTMAKLRMAQASTHGARKHAWRMQAAWAKVLNVVAWAEFIKQTNFVL